MIQPIVIGLTFALHAQWSASTAMDLHQRVEALRAKGEPVLVADFKPKSIDPKDNAKSELEAAFKVLRTDSEAWQAVQLRDDEPKLPLSPEWAELLKQITAENADALKYLAAAHQKPLTDAQIEFKTPVLMMARPMLMKTRESMYLLRYRAWHAASAGRYDDAMSALGQTEALSAFAGSHRTLIGHLVATGIDSSHAETLIRLSPHLQVGDAPGNVSRKVVAEQIARLMDHAALRNSARQGFQGERMQVLDSIAALRSGKLNANRAIAIAPQLPIDARSLMHPVLNMNARVALDYMTLLIDASDAPDAPAFQKSLGDKTRALEKDLERMPYRLAGILVPSLARAATVSYTAMTHREAAATALAIRLYQRDHNDQRPARLEDLVPKYLPRLPRDYLADNQPLRYRAGDTPILWSVGDDGIDSGGKEADPNLSLREQRDRVDVVWKLGAE